MSCGNTNHATQNDETMHATGTTRLVKQDLANRNLVDDSGLAYENYLTGQSIAKIFGGTSNENVNEYLDTRLHYYVGDEDTGSLNPPDLDEKPWNKGELNLNQDSTAKGTLGAFNYGMSLWMDAILSNTSASFTLNGKTEPIDSPRVGIVVLGPGYTDVVQGDDGHFYRLPMEFRLSLLVHEARHSDCTGGMNQAQINTVKAFTNSTQYIEYFQNGTCGHMHTICPPSHEFHGLAACDLQAWGAYAIQAEYLRGLSLSSRYSVGYQNFLRNMAIDAESRYVGPKRAPTYPDMSSEGVLY
jgi:hypothetical protein